jgi:hypothetical protein
MMAYAAGKGTELAPDLIEKLSAISATHSDHLEPATTRDFWISYGKLAKSITPVTAESLRCCLDPRDEAPTPAQRAARKYNRWGYVVLVMLFLVQGYWFVLNSVSESLQKNIDQIKPYALLYHSMEKKVKDDLKRPPTDQEVEAAKSEFLANNASKVLASPEVAASNKHELNSDEEWYLRLALRADSAALRRIAGWFSWVIYPSSIKDAGFAYYDLKADTQRDIQSARYILDILNRYILPVLYGLVGAILYVIRRLAAEIRDATYTLNSNVGFTLRFFMGGIVGLAIAWFVLPSATVGQGAAITQPTTLGSLSPLTLSFVAGYAVEILFSLIDRIVSTFTTSETRTAKSET